MEARRIRWATNRRTGEPVLIDSIVADIDPATGEASLSQRGQEVIDEVMESGIASTKAYVVPAIDLPDAVHRLIQAKHKMGIPVRSRLPKGYKLDETTSDSDVTSGVPEIDAILLALYQRMLQEHSGLLGKPSEAISIEDLRNGPIGQALLRLFRVANGAEQSSSREIFELADFVEKFLSHTMERELLDLFHTLLSQAEGRTVNSQEWIGIEEAARTLGVTQSAIMRLFSNSRIRYRVDEISGEAIFYLSDVLAEKHTHYR